MQAAKRVPRPGTLLMAAGALLLAGALALTVFNLWDERRAGMSAQRLLAELELPAGSETPPVPPALTEQSPEMPTVQVEGNACLGTLSIDTLGLVLPVLDNWTYSQLKLAPCRFAGSCYAGGFVIAGHNYRTHFGPLDRLTPGDRVVFTCVDGTVFKYEVSELQVLSPTAVEEMTDDGWDLSLFTCTLSGQARLTVRCTALPLG